MGAAVIGGTARVTDDEHQMIHALTCGPDRRPAVPILMAVGVVEDHGGDRDLRREETTKMGEGPDPDLPGMMVPVRVAMVAAASVNTEGRLVLQTGRAHHRTLLNAVVVTVVALTT